MAECRIYIYAILDSLCVSPIHVVPKKGGFTVIRNKKNELIPTRTMTGWRMCIDYRKLITATRKDHYPLPFINQMLDRLARHLMSQSIFLIDFYIKRPIYMQESGINFTKLLCSKKFKRKQKLQ